MSDQERDKLQETDDEAGEDVEAHKLQGRLASDEESDEATDDDSGDDVEAHKMHGKDS